MTCAPDIDLADAQPTIEVHRPKPHVAVVTLGGEHDLDSAPLVKQATEEALLTSFHLIVDISPVRFIDSRIINLLVNLKRTPTNGTVASTSSWAPNQESSAPSRSVESCQH
jgi:anti-anti-sigma regulatory factor